MRTIYTLLFIFSIIPNLHANGLKTLISINSNYIVKSAKNCGLTVSGNGLAFLTGNKKQIKCLKEITPKIKDGSHKSFWNDQPLTIIKGEPTLFNNSVHYLASKELGLDKWNEKYPLNDGRGVKIGIIDDGVAPDTSGMLTTPNGQRKILQKFSSSSYYTFRFFKVERDSLYPNYNKSMGTLYKGVVHRRKKYQVEVPIKIDPTNDVIKYKAIVLIDNDGNEKICINLNKNGKVEKEECISNFSKTGEFLYWDKDKAYAFVAEFDKEKETVWLSEGEWRARDSHGEGVASVLAGYQIAGVHSGMAPGAQLLDYDLSEGSNVPSENIYTIGTFLKALDVLGNAGAEVINISYSLFFQSTMSQLIMEEALAALVEKYNFVITFSAGNNGPGLMSLNRRSIYPYSSLVVGAFISKELDEYVHGTTGVPEEGRVIFYSSRGPGPDMGSGPTIISPLAALTASNPTKGFSAFSGTSSAAPAMGGMVASLISGIKRAKLPLIAQSVINAVRLSATPIPGAAYIEQGMGVPNIVKSFKIYKTLISGQQFEDIDIDIRNVKGFGGVQAKGILLFKDELTNIYQRLVHLRGITSPVLTDGQTKNMFSELNLEYSHNWIVGPKHLWVAKGKSRFEFGVVPTKMNNDYEELLGEIKLIDSRSNLIIGVIPITIINKARLDRTVNKSVMIGAEEGKRIHLNIPKETKAIKVSYNILSGPTPNISFYLFNKNGVKSESSHWKDESEEGSFILPIHDDGHHQLTVSKYKGSTYKTNLELKITPVNLTLLSKGLSASAPELIVRNEGKQISGKFHLKASDVLLTKKIIDVSSNKTTVTYPTGTVGTIRTRVTPLAKAVNSYLYPAYCHMKVLNSSKEIIHEAVDTQIFIGTSIADEAKEVELNCITFDMSEEKLLLQVLFHKKVPSIPLGIQTIMPGYNTLTFPSPEYINHKNYDLIFGANRGSSGGFTIGSISFID